MIRFIILARTTEVDLKESKVKVKALCCDKSGQSFYWGYTNVNEKLVMFKTRAEADTCIKQNGYVGAFAYGIVSVK